MNSFSERPRQSVHHLRSVCVKCNSFQSTWLNFVFLRRGLEYDNIDPNLYQFCRNAIDELKVVLMYETSYPTFCSYTSNTLGVLWGSYRSLVRDTCQLPLLDSIRGNFLPNPLLELFMLILRLKFLDCCSASSCSFL
jgi:hypothetical protein